MIEFKGKKYSISFVRDITTQKNDKKQKSKLETHLRQAQKMESLGMLAGRIAHDFNNILSVICGYSELAQLKCPEDSSIGKYIR